LRLVPGDHLRLMSLDTIVVGCLKEGLPAARRQQSNVLPQLLDIVDKLPKVMCGLNRLPGSRCPLAGRKPLSGRKRTPDRHVGSSEFGKGRAARSPAATGRHRAIPETRATRADRCRGEDQIRVCTPITAAISWQSKQKWETCRDPGARRANPMRLMPSSKLVLAPIGPLFALSIIPRWTTKICRWRMREPYDAWLELAAHSFSLRSRMRVRNPSARRWGDHVLIRVP
jgi:hypothetical protein